MSTPTDEQIKALTELAASISDDMLAVYDGRILEVDALLDSFGGPEAAQPDGNGTFHRALVANLVGFICGVACTGAEQADRAVIDCLPLTLALARRIAAQSDENDGDDEPDDLGEPEGSA